MNWQEFEDKLKDRVHGYETPLDTDALWEQVRPKKRRRFVLIFWWCFGIIGLLNGLVWMAHWNGITVNSPKNEKVAPENQEKAIVKGKESTVPAQENKQEADNSTHTNAYSTTAKPDFSPSQNLHTKERLTEQQAGNTTVGNLAQSQAENGVSGLINLSNLPESEVSGALEESVVPGNLEEKQSTVALSRSRNVLSIYLLPITPMPVHSIAAQMLDLPVGPYTPTPFVSTIQPSKPRFQVGIQTGLAYWGKNQKTTVDPVLPRTNERLLESFNLGINYQTPIASRWDVRVGIQYLRFNSVFNWQTSSVVANQDELVLNYDIEGGVDTTYLPGALVERTRTIQQHNRNSSITIPIDLKYRIPIRRGVLAPFVGLQPGFFQSGKGVILDGQNRPDYGIFSKVYDRSFGLGFRAGVSLELTFHKNYALLIEPAGGIDLISRTAKSDPNPQKFWQIGMNVGVVRSFH